MYNFSEVIKELRKSKGMSQETLAKRIGVTKSMISSYETFSSDPSYKNLVKIARIFNVSTDYLFGLSKEKKDVIDVTGIKNEQRDILDGLIQYFKAFNEITEYDLENSNKSNDDFYSKTLDKYSLLKIFNNQK